MHREDLAWFFGVGGVARVFPDAYADRPLVGAVSRLPDVPITIVHGRRDLVCPVEAAWTLHRAIPGSRLILLSDAGHLAVESAMIDALVGETNRGARERDWPVDVSYTSCGQV